MTTGPNRQGDTGRHHGAAALRKTATGVLAATVKAGAATYQRERDLAALIRIDCPSSSADGEADAATVIARLERALRSERHKARSGHWTYDLNRHIALRQAYVAETARLGKPVRASC